MTTRGEIKGTSEKRLVPELRFPEFEKDGEWSVEKLGDIAKTFSGGTPSINNKDYYGGDIPFIRSGEINNDATELFLTKLGVEKSSAKIVEKGTILYALYGATSGEVAISKIKGAINQAILAIIPDTKYSTIYIYHFLKNGKKAIIDCFLQGGQGNLSGTIINSLSVPFPSPDEQQKIAECLSSIDEEISALKEKVVQLKAHKKGLMQKLFPDAGKFLPEIRFPEFKNDGGWKDKRLENLCKIGNGKDYKHLNKGHIPVYGSGGYMTSVDDFLYDGDSVCIGRKGTIDRPIFLTGKFWTVDTLFYTHSFCCCLPKFLYCFFQQIDWYRYNEAGGVPSLSKKTIEKIKLPFPSHAEQQEIAECLSSIDELISLYEDKVSLMEQHKKGLMQRLFPKQINS